MDNIAIIIITIYLLDTYDAGLNISQFKLVSARHCVKYFTYFFFSHLMYIVTLKGKHYSYQLHYVDEKM